jgi:hypothetical protein
MKPSKPLWALILIASALLLSAARSASALPPNSKKSERTTKTHNHRATAENRTTPQACPSVTVIVKEIPAPEAKQITAVIQQQPHQHWWQSQNAPEWALFFLTIPYVIVSVGLFVVTWRAADAAESSAGAALISAQVAKQAIHTDRPLVIVEAFDAGVDAQRFSFSPVVNFRNFGNSPAILIEVCLGLQTVFVVDIILKRF